MLDVGDIINGCMFNLVFFKKFFRYFEIAVWSKEYICCGKTINKKSICDENDKHWK
jgi:hypothetical protein